MTNIVLIGFMGAGKSSVGRVLARSLEYDFIDTDEQIEREQRKKISVIFEKYGEAAFRDMETELLRRLQRKKGNFVLSVGGGMPVREENRQLLQSLGTVVYLKASKETIIARVSGDQNRPLLQGEGLEEKVAALMAARAQIYEETANVQLQTDDCTVEELVQKLVAFTGTNIL